MKICSRCKITKDESEFFKRKDGACGLRSHCKECCRNYVNSDKGKEIARRYNRSLKRKLKHRVHGQKYSRSEHGIAARKRYMRSENGRRAARNGFLHRREREIGLKSKLSLQEVNLIYNRFRNTCFNCGTNERLEIDHHKPLVRGFGLTQDNAVILCRNCNASKKDKSPEDFYTEQQLSSLAVIFRSSSMVERDTVNIDVGGSIPSAGANINNGK